ncbi:hypothetical protein [Methylobacterium sp. A54F]
MPADKTAPALHPAADPDVLHVEGAIDAPILFFDDSPALGFGGGVFRMMLCTLIQDVDADGTLIQRKKVVAHLRGSGQAFEKLRRAIDAMEAMVAKPEGPAN